MPGHYQIIKQVNPLKSGEYACTVMAVRKTTAGRNEFAVTICATLEATEKAIKSLEADVRSRVESTGGVIAGAELVALESPQGA
jgi:hypothetical protein